MIQRYILSLITTLFFAITLSAHSGKVFVDSNKNGLYDKGERVLKGIMVSDGKNVVKTNSNGVFELPGHSNERFITVTTPTGYKAGNKHYIKIDEDVDSYDFPLESWNSRIAKDGSHKFIQLSDTEIFNTSDQERWAHNVRDYAKNEDVAFIIHTGDICYESGLKAHIKLMNSKNMGCPVYYCIGNHDLVKGDSGEQLFESIYGPVWFSFDYGNVHYVVTPMPYGDHAPSYTEAEVYEWIKNDLALVNKETPIIIFNHDLMSYTEEFIFKKNNSEKLVLNDLNVKGWFYGHWHNHFIRQQGKIKTISTATLDKGGIDHSTSAFRLASIDSKGNIDTQLRYTYIDKNLVISSISNSLVTTNDKGQVPLMVNAYNSISPVRDIVYTLYDDNKTIEMKRKLNQKTDWSWYVDMDIPEQYINQNLFIEVTAQFENGEVAKAKEHFVYKPKDTDVILKENWTTLLANSEHVGHRTDSLNLPIKLTWINNVKGNIFMSSPLIYNNSIYVATVDEDLRGEGGIYALDAKSGKIKWFYRTRNSIKNTIAIEGENVFAQDAEGYLYAVNTESGKLVWEKKLQVEGLPVLDDGLTTREGVVYAGSGKGLSAYDARTGEQKWINTSWEQGEGTTSTIAADDKVVISGAQWRAMHGNDTQTGKHLWSQRKNGISNRGSTPTIHNGLAYFIASKSFFIIEVETGNVIISKELPYNVDVTSTPLVTADLIVFGTASDGLVALDRETYKEKWRVKTLPALVYTAPYTRYPSATIETSPVSIDKYIVFGASDGSIYVVNSENGKIIWEHKTGAPIYSTVAVSGNTFVITDFGGNVYAFTFN